MSKKHKPITIQRMKADLAKIHNIVVREEKVLTHLRYNKYIGNIHVRFVGSINIADDEDAYQKSLQLIEKKLNRKIRIHGIQHIQILDISISGVHSQEEIDDLHKNKEKSKNTLPNLKTVVKKQKIPKGSLRHRVKMHISGSKEEMQNTIDQISNLFGDDKSESTYVNIPSLEWFKRYKSSIYDPLAAYINFENEDDIIMLAPFNNHSCIRSMKLEIFDGQ